MIYIRHEVTRFIHLQVCIYFAIVFVVLKICATTRNSR